MAAAATCRAWLCCCLPGRARIAPSCLHVLPTRARWSLRCRQESRKKNEKSERLTKEREEEAAAMREGPGAASEPVFRPTAGPPDAERKMQQVAELQEALALQIEEKKAAKACAVAACAPQSCNQSINQSIN